MAELKTAEQLKRDFPKLQLAYSPWTVHFEYLGYENGTLEPKLLKDDAFQAIWEAMKKSTL